MTLHIVNNLHRFNLELCDSKDVILFIEDGVYGQIDATQKLYVLKADREARGLRSDPSRIDIDYDQFVALCADHDKVVSW